MKNHFKQTDADSVRISVHNLVGRALSFAIYGSIKRTVPAYVTRNKKLEIVGDTRWDIEDEIRNYEFPENKF